MWLQATVNIPLTLTYISKLLYIQDRLYAFVTTHTENVMVSELFIYDEDLNLLDKIDISECYYTIKQSVEFSNL